VLVCLAGVLITWAALPVMAETGAGYWNFSASAPVEPGPQNQTGHPAPDINETILPGDPLYGLKLSFEHLDQSFTANTTVRVEKQMHYTENRLVEAEQAFRANRTGVAEQALGQYLRDLDATLRTIASINASSPDNARAKEVAARHLATLNRTIARYPGRVDLLTAYNHTSELAGKKPVIVKSETGLRTAGNNTAINTPTVKGQNLTVEHRQNATNSTNHTAAGETRLLATNLTAPAGTEGKT
jgi:hypothetical protein